MRKLLLTSLLLLPLAALADTCPEAENIVRTPGENSWFSNEPGWEGGFNAPTPGNGYSTDITHFMKAHWIQTTNVEEAPGYVVCDYKGNYDDEIIRFIQSVRASAERPNSVNWQCQINQEYPSTACTCSALEEQCVFD